MESFLHMFSCMFYWCSHGTMLLADSPTPALVVAVCVGGCANLSIILQTADIIHPHNPKPITLPLNEALTCLMCISVWSTWLCNGPIYTLQSPHIIWQQHKDLDIQWEFCASWTHICPFLLTTGGWGRKQPQPSPQHCLLLLNYPMELHWLHCETDTQTLK